MSDELDEVEDFDDDLDLTLYADQRELLEEVTAQAIEVIETGLRINGIFHLALTGGTLGSDLTRALVANWNSHPDTYLSLIHI
jgi:6-phosphogluconolactonase/glucosamine-6-phosphate isomerase/deaminase